MYLKPPSFMLWKSTKSTCICFSHFTHTQSAMVTNLQSRIERWRAHWFYHQTLRRLFAFFFLAMDAGFNKTFDSIFSDVAVLETNLLSHQQDAWMLEHVSETQRFKTNLCGPLDGEFHQSKKTSRRLWRRTSTLGRWRLQTFFQPRTARYPVSKPAHNSSIQNFLKGLKPANETNLIFLSQLHLLLVFWGAWLVAICRKDR